MEGVSQELTIGTIKSREQGIVLDLSKVYLQQRCVVDKIQRDKNIIYHTITTYIHTFLKKSFKILIYLSITLYRYNYIVNNIPYIVNNNCSR